MIHRLYLKDLLGFDEVELEFAPGLVVFTGPSGAGKSVLMGAMLAALGHGSAEAALCEMEFDRPEGLESEAYALDEILSVKTLRKGRVAYYLEGQKISKKALSSMLAPYFRTLSVRDRGGLESEVLLELLDRALGAKDAGYTRILEEFSRRYAQYAAKRAELDAIEAKERQMRERIEFLRFEIERIDAVAPKEGEYEELLEIKQRLSRIDRIREAMDRASTIFELEGAVDEVFELMGKDGSYFSDTMNQLRSDFEDIENLAEELAELDVEQILDRLEQLSGLITRHGSIEEALRYRDEKAQKLAGFEHIEEDKSALEAFLEAEEQALGKLAGEISLRRQAEAEAVAKAMAPNLERLKLPGVRFTFEHCALGSAGVDRVGLELTNRSTVATLSGGEFNRLRLALLAATALGTAPGEGVIFLDEIDANVSGDESIAIAEMITRLASVYQVFAISHQPHLSARAHQHILVNKEGDRSRARSLEAPERIREIARIVGGEKADAEATAFAEKLYREAQNAG
ncbi:AAA family ATPase [Nitratifractor salsuginis]|uniref:DNA repair protein RecN n=1 Tax=Nitratifractor salsuginis (strain DSM 16511 / JCM 12458 / E9I37-1) TaxID=749222 RepID=E6WY16_NITSE|nr:AAA family ATPase [Nitratifractor salsuginis]ADV46390.1 SMC domain protein [Nitratifractor salsuginis DSM 16511]